MNTATAVAPISGSSVTGKLSFFISMLLCGLTLNAYVAMVKIEATKVSTSVNQPSRSPGEVLVTWPGLVNQLNKTKPECKPLLHAAEKVAGSWFGWMPVPDNVWDKTLLDFKAKARLAGCLVLHKGEAH
ncbi:hypothetical protein [Cupriavidus sp. TMH.W2]|uniref:hypothetical protein n=1 Tax=Cupriavidus sp. TMH.W2 TaxID=3434465 RepID=UPI003D7757CD